MMRTCFRANVWRRRLSLGVFLVIALSRIPALAQGANGPRQASWIYSPSVQFQRTMPYEMFEKAVLESAGLAGITQKSIEGILQDFKFPIRLCLASYQKHYVAYWDAFLELIAQPKRCTNVTPPHLTFRIPQYFLARRRGEENTAAWI